MSALFVGFRRLDEAEMPVASNPLAPNQTAQPQREAAPALAPELKRLVQERTCQWHAESARAQRVFGVLIEMAGELCMAEFEAELKMRSRDLLQGSPDKLKAFLVAVLKPKLDAAKLAGKADLPAVYQQLQAAHGQLQSEHGRLVVDAELSKQEVIALRQQLAGAEAALAEAGRRLTAVTESPAASALKEEPLPAAPAANMAVAKADNGRVDELVRLIAATGLARLNKIRERLATAWDVVAKGGSVRNVVNAAKEAGYIKLFEAKADWQGPAKPIFVELTAAGARRAQLLGVEPTRSEIAEGIQRGFTLEQLNLILRAAELLNEEGYRTVTIFPKSVMLSGDQMYQPTLSAISPDGSPIYVECEREKVDEPRDQRWRLAALAGNGQLWLITTTPAMQDALVSEVNLSRLRAPFAFAAANVVDYTSNRRGKTGGVWTYLS
jgi:hypothetical protein